MTVMLLIVVVILLLATLTVLLRGSKRFSPLEYYARGHELGFSFQEARKILAMARVAGVPDPTAALWSVRELDMTIKAFVQRHREDGTERDRDVITFMDKLYTFRKQVEFDQPRYKRGLASSRSIVQGQRLRILVPGLGVYGSTVIDSNDRYLVISYPAGGRVPAGFKWRGTRVSVYFWRQDDAGYVFDTYVLEDLRIRDIPVLQLGHSNSLLRTQKRKSVRARAKIGAYLYVLKRLEGAYEKPERVPGLKCVVQDLSEDGLAVLIGGKARVGMQVKVQFVAAEAHIVMSGTVRSADFNMTTNQSLLHIEAASPSARMRNLIRAHVYSIGPSGNGAQLDVDTPTV